MAKNLFGNLKAWQLAVSLIIAFVLIFSAVSLIFLDSMYKENFPRRDRPQFSGYLQFSDIPDYPYTAVHFPSGKNSLAGYIFGEENTKGLVVIAPGQGMGAERYLAETRYFVDHGWRVFSFDPTGCYASGGENMVGLPQSRLDLEAALAYIESSPALNGLPVVLWGHSWGGYAVAAVLQDHADIRAVASISSFNSPYALMNEVVRSEIGVLGIFEYPLAWAYQTARFGRSAGITAVDGINRSQNIPVMLIHDLGDADISYAGASIIAQRERITNPNVVYVTRQTASGKPHIDLLRSAAALQYIRQKNEEFQVIYDNYGGNVPDSEIAAYHAGVDHFRTSELDPDLIAKINSFFESGLVDE